MQNADATCSEYNTKQKLNRLFRSRKIQNVIVIKIVFIYTRQIE